MRKSWIIAVCLAIVGAAYLPAQQTITGTILGRVLDPSGAPVPEAQVTIANTQTGSAVDLVTDSRGGYAATNLLPGIYDVRAHKTGFAAFEARQMQLTAGSTLRLDVDLKLGAVSEVVTVTGSAPMVQTDSPAISTSVSTQQMAELPSLLQTVDTMLSLAAGVQAGAGSENANPPIGGGTHWGSVDFSVNGASANDPGNSGAATVQGKGLLVLPAPSSLEELEARSNGLNAKSRNKSSVMLVTKGGTNQFHGQLFETNQNNAFAANQFLLNATGRPRPFTNVNQFGGNIGGPIVKNRAFFFFDFNGFRERLTSVLRHNFPSMAMRQGDFSALCSAYDASGACQNANQVQLYNPWTGKPFPGNVLPSDTIAPQAKGLLKYLPAPTDPSSRGLPNGSPNYVGVIPAAHNSNGVSTRFDYRLRPSDTLFGVFSLRLADPWDGVGSAVADYGNGRNAYKYYNVNATETHIFNANTINEFRLAWSNYPTRFGGQNQDFNAQSLFPQLPATFVRGLPNVSASGYDGLFADNGTAFFTPRHNIEISDNFTHIRGAHRWEMGFSEMGWRVSSRVPSANNPTGSFSFNGRWTGNVGWPGQPRSAGNAFADFLLGAANSTQTTAVGRFAEWIYSRDWAFYVQDTWQASPRLTLNYGIRYDYQSPWRYRTAGTTTIDLANGKLIIPQKSTTPVIPANASPDLWAAYQYETTAALGLPLDYIRPDRNDWSPRVGFALRPFGGKRTVLRGSFGIYYNFQPAFVGSRADAWNPPWQLSITQTFSSKLPGNPQSPFVPDLSFANPFPGGGGASAVSPNPSLYMFEHNFRHAMVQEWTLTAEREFGGNWATRATYIGNHTYHIPYNFGPINVPAVQIPNMPTQAQRPYQPWGAISATRSAGKQIFEQLQWGVQRRFASGFLFKSEYQFTRSLDTVPQSGGPMIWSRPNLDYGNSDGLRRHWLVFNYIYELPWGRGRHWLRNAGAWPETLLGGWRVSGISQYGTSTPFSVSFSQTGVNKIGWWGGRADRVPGVPLYARQEGHDVVRGVQWFNPAAFAPPQPWTWGNASRNLLFGPGMWNWEMSLAKTFPVREKVTLQFRADAFNVFNHFNLGAPTASIADTRDGGSPVPNAGKILGGSGNRRMQLGLRLRW